MSAAFDQLYLLYKGGGSLNTLGRLLVNIAILSIVAGIASSLIHSSETARRVRMVSSLLMMVLIFSPLTDIDLQTFLTPDWHFQDEGLQYARQGDSLSRKARGDIIQAELSAYIESRAAEQGISVDAQVRVSQSELSIPEFVLLRGRFTDSQRQTFSRQITQELGITGENQQWMWME